MSTQELGFEKSFKGGRIKSMHEQKVVISLIIQQKSPDRNI